ncbi:MAG: lipocalin family protein [Candidatus Thiodiazotropha endolucinida]
MNADKRKWFCVAVSDISRRIVYLLAACLVLASCTQLPRGIQPVSGFEIDRYLGTWYEIARLDHRFEKGLNNVTANYTLRNDGGINVINRGYAPKDQAWKEAQGKAFFVGDKQKGHLQVSFFGPFYSSYVIFELDKDDYQYAFVSGYNRDYLWLLARKPNNDKKIIKRFLDRSKSFGFDTDEIIFVDHSHSFNK